MAVSTLLLAGVALAALNGALMGLIAYSSDDRELRDLTLWMLGSLSGASWPKVFAIIPFALLVALVLPRLIRGLNGLLLGEAEAFHLGIDVERTKRGIVLVTSAAVGAAVAVSGILGFVGIVVPHLVRLLAGPDHRIVLPASALMGATLVLTADILARMLLRPAELPLGVVMAILGAPIFLHMVVKRGMAGAEPCCRRATSPIPSTATRWLPGGRGGTARPRGGADRTQRSRQVDLAAHPCRRTRAHERHGTAR